MKIVPPFTLAIIFVLLYATFGRVRDALFNHGQAAVCIDWRRLVTLSAALQFVGGSRGGFYRVGGRCGGIPA
ncbi:hypothetical protein BG74_09600 [Sodalis-like endosymbiont of Proechinophthirus fluctus]|nr:hypothetical protein BG74_09600 [Sodalis-like endosymbiont of Proechinophthirus fluctus]